MAHNPDILTRLMRVIQERRGYTMTTSYTHELLRAGVSPIGEKVMEEAGELVEAATISDDTERAQQMIHEAADLQYHMMVMLAACGLTIWDVERELERRFGTSGLDEKASRSDK